MCHIEEREEEEEEGWGKGRGYVCCVAVRVSVLCVFFVFRRRRVWCSSRKATTNPSTQERRVRAHFEKSSKK